MLIVIPMYYSYFNSINDGWVLWDVWWDGHHHIVESILHQLGATLHPSPTQQNFNKLTINKPVDYKARAIMILMWGKDIMRAIGKVGPFEVKTFLGPKESSVN